MVIGGFGGLVGKGDFVASCPLLLCKWYHHHDCC